MLVLLVLRDVVCMGIRSRRCSEGYAGMGRRFCRAFGIGVDELLKVVLEHVAVGKE